MMVKFIYKFSRVYSGIRDRIVGVHNSIKSYKGEDDKNPYQVFLDWLYDVLTFGAGYAFVYSCFAGWQGWRTLVLILSFGIARSLLVDFVEIIKGK